MFALAWLGLALQPCGAMESHGDAGMATHESASAGAAHDCPHCPPPAEPVTDLPCGNALSCEAIGAPALPAKALDAQPADFVFLMPLPDLASGVVPRPVPLRPPRLAGRWTPTSSPQQRFCCFLK